jgi:CRP-like cAMP-binding protein
VHDTWGQDLGLGGPTGAQRHPLRNRLLVSIPARELSQLRPHLHSFSLEPRSILHEPTQKLTFVSFPNSGVISLLVATEDGKTVEAGMLGNEGFAGVPAVVGFHRCPLRQVVQIGGEGLRIKAAALQRILPSAPHLQMALVRYAVIQGMQVAQIAACNRLHDAGQRLARWLLMAADRSGGCVIPMTHDFLSATLGTDRPSISLAAKILQRRKVIAYKRRLVTILNRKKLEGSACECYSAIGQFTAACTPNEFRPVRRT